ncbi:methyl-accepting chemotaxis protein [Noviherbaspirillum pedocola]|uniref:MCP four helix bundle domain-containing protein n=1 Tax=Noviherbaspirillum pedocola TaxID=2801341 RepID=A0A934W8X4_9BURK|nr:methyl-accepting chemotaxis protein [Noviherbaspirillum pedocola]MBK4737338.1 MCP four helix bundle domain-containing protein [Noviherbaspirillum pedocola]
MKLRYKLPIAFVVISFVVAAAGSVGLYKLHDAANDYAEVIRVDYGNEQQISSMLFEFKTQVQEWKDTLLRGKDPQQLEKYWGAFQTHEKAVDDAARKLQSSLLQGEVRTLVTEFADAHRKMGEDYRKGFEQFKAANFDHAVGDAAVKGKDRAPAELLNKARAKIVEATQARVAHAKEASDAASLLSIVLMLAGLFAAAISGVVLSRAITRPLNKAVEIADKVANGDLTSDIVPAGDEEIRHLLASLKQMNGNLVEIVGRIRGGTETIATGSREIAMGNQDLSSRTESQASSLEETASSMEELTATVKQNVDSAAQANHLATAASEVAVKGGAAVAQVVDTMNAIEADAKRIADITSVIDGIAFQTNILALNAAVEAARAGEQGRGFAVVASEVRSLAQRSAAAAKEIKTVIGGSVERVGQGSKLVGEAGATINEVVESVHRVNDIMSEILAASREQSGGIEQINQAVAQMDEVTQQNAALVEEAAAAAESMHEQAASLAQTVAVFQVKSRTTEVAQVRSTQPYQPKGNASFSTSVNGNGTSDTLASTSQKATTSLSRTPIPTVRPTLTDAGEWEEF